MPILRRCGKLAVMAARDGDGWVNCRCGSKHWGVNGAAGLLLYRADEILLQHRAPWVHNGDTWGIPGGARDSHESALEAALRESNEEIGIESRFVTTQFSHLDDHIDWRYETIVAHLEPEGALFKNNHETIDLRWFAIARVSEVNLHPSFARSWPTISARLLQIVGGGGGETL